MLSPSGWFGYSGSHNTSGNPQFINAPSNLNLGCTSSCRNTGSNSFVYCMDPADLDDDGNQNESIPKDIGGNTRILYSTVDIGAYESTGICGM